MFASKSLLWRPQVPLDHADFDQVTLDDVQELIDTGVREGRRIEYKSAQYDWDRGRAPRPELCKDVSAMANTDGGHILIGVSEDAGAPTSVSPLVGLDADGEIRRMDQILRTGIEPRINAVRIRALPTEDGIVLACRIPRSFNVPHQVVVEGANKFYVRTNAGCHECSVDELRALFGRGPGMRDRLNAYVSQRHGEIVAGRVGPRISRNDGCIVLHIVPFSALGGNEEFDLSPATHDDFRPLAASDWREHPSFSGLMYVREGDPSHGYTEVHRNGIVEAVKTNIHTDYQQQPAILGNVVIEDIVRGLQLYMGALRRLGVTPPFYVQVAMLNVPGRFMVLPDIPTPAFARPILAPNPTYPASLVPRVIEIPDYLDPEGYERLLQPAMDAFVSAAGVAHCKYFDAEGRFTIPRDGRRW